MLKTRVIPCLLLQDSGFVKTVKFKKTVYLGGPINILKIFNEKEVDEVIVLDISATMEERPVNFELIKEITSECFMPLCYGGGITNTEDAARILELGVEKVAVNSYAVDNPEFVSECAKLFGSQSIVVSIDVKKSLLGRYQIFTHGGRKNTKLDPVAHAVQMQELGAGELLLNSIDNDGTMKGYDTELIKTVSTSVSIPVIACGGAGKTEDLLAANRIGGASAVAAGSMFVFQGKYRAVLINYPSYKELIELFNNGLSLQTSRQY
jgi:cyclase